MLTSHLDRRDGGTAYRPLPTAYRVLVVLIAFALSGCTSTRPGGSQGHEVVVFAAASLAEPFKEVATAYEGTHPGQIVRLNFGGSNQLRAQIEQGARTDVFAAASVTEMAKARASGIVGGDTAVFARNRLTVIVPKGSPIGELRDLARPGRKVVVAGPGVPVGSYTLELLDRLSADPAYGADFKARVLANVVSQETDVKQVVAKAQLGEADAGFVYVSDLTPATAERVTALTVPEQHNPFAAYPIGVTTDARNPSAATAFVAFALSDEGQAILGRHGFLRGDKIDGAGVTSSHDGLAAEAAGRARRLKPQATVTKPTCVGSSPDSLEGCGGVGAGRRWMLRPQPPGLGQQVTAREAAAWNG